MSEDSECCKNFFSFKALHGINLFDACYKRKIKNFDSRKLQLLEENMHEVHVLHIIPPPPPFSLSWQLLGLT